MPILGIIASRDGGTPTAPTIGTATAGNGLATVAYTASTYTGKGAATYLATSSPGSFTGTGASPITVSGLTNGTSYTFTVKATSTTGETATSAASNSVTPTTPQAFNSIATLSGSGTTTVTFSSIPSTYKSLQLRCYVRDSLSVNPSIRFNGDTGSNYGYSTSIYYTGSGGTLSRRTDTTLTSSLTGSLIGTTSNASTYVSTIIDIPDYASTSKSKIVSAISGYGSLPQQGSGIWNSTAAINSITITLAVGSWQANTSFALYGVS